MSAFYVVAYGALSLPGDPRGRARHAARAASRRSSCSAASVAALALVVAFEAWRTRPRADRASGSVRARWRGRLTSRSSAAGSSASPPPTRSRARRRRRRAGALDARRRPVGRRRARVPPPARDGGADRRGGPRPRAVGRVVARARASRSWGRRARCGWAATSRRDAARLRAAGVAAEVLERAGERHRRCAPTPGRCSGTRAAARSARGARSTGWARELGDRVRRTEVIGRARRAGWRPRTARCACGHVVLCAGAGTERLWPHVAMRRVVHLRVTFAARAAAGGSHRARRRGRTAAGASARAPTASRTGRAASRSASPSSTRSRRRRTPPPTSSVPRVDLAAVRARAARLRARRVPRASARRSTRSSGCSPCCPATTRTRTCSTRGPG